MNSINIMGRACSKPTLKYISQQGLACAEFTLAVDTRHGPKDANGKRKAMFFMVTAWGKTAETITGWLEKGQVVAITGRLSQDEFTPAGSDKPVQKTRIVCESYTLGQKPAGHQQPAPQDPAPPSHSAAPTSAPPADEPDEIPF